MNPEQLWETTMDPEHRMLKKVTIDNAQVSSDLFTMLMGEEVGPRKSFITNHSTEANLDI